MTARVTHATVTGAAANPDVLVDGPAWDADHIITGVREILTAPRTYHVEITGDDSSSTGLSAGSAFRTIQKAIDTIADTLDGGGNNTVTVQVGHGNYSAGLVTAKGFVGFNGPGGVIILGSPTPSDVVIAVTSQDAFGIGETAFGAGTSGRTEITIAGVKITTTTAGNCINASGFVALTLGLPGYPIDYGSCAQTHIVGNHGAWVIAGTNNLVSGGATIHAAALSNSVVALHGTTETFSNSPAFTYYASADTGGTLFVDGMTFTNKATVTGTRYFAGPGGLIYALGNATYLPGNVAGVEYEGGKYVADVGVTGIPSYAAGILSYIAPATGIAAWLATPSSANLRAALTDETGAGAAYFAGGALGTPASGVATNLTGTAAGLTAGAVPASGITGTILPAAVVVSSLTSLGTLSALAVSGSAASFTNNGAGGQLFGGTSSDTGQTYFQLNNTSAGGSNWQFANSGSVNALPVGSFYFWNSVGSYRMALFASGGAGFNTTTDPGSGNLFIPGTYKSGTAATAVSGAGPFAIGSASTLNARIKINMNGVDYWIPASTTAF